jgi:hypothetical protein
VVTVETPLAVQAHRAQGGTDGPPTRSEDGAHQEHLGVSPDALGEKWREGGQSACTILGGRVRTLRSPLLAEIGDERTLPLSLSNG